MRGESQGFQSFGFIKRTLSLRRNFSARVCDLFGMSISSVPRKILSEKHRLSVNQIDELRQESQSGGDWTIKLESFSLIRALMEIAGSFAERGIGFVPLKGPVLSFRLYGDATHRHSRDLDILTAPGKVSDALQLLTALGYRYVTLQWPEKTDLQRILLKHTNQLSLHHPESGVTVELHWRLLNVLPFPENVLDEIVAAHRESFNLGEQEFTVMSPELELLYLVIHGGLHYWRRLKWLVDVHGILGQWSIDWEEFRRLVDRFHAGRMVALCNQALERYFPGSKTIPLEAEVSDFLVKYSFRKIDEKADLEHDTLRGMLLARYYSLRCFPGWLYKLRVVRRYLFVDDNFGQSPFWSVIPLFYLYGPAQLLKGRMKRRGSD